VWFFKPKLSTWLYIKLLKSLGVNFKGTPNYLSAKIWFDSANYGLIEIGEGATISSNVRVLTHDWSCNTVLKSYEKEPLIPLGKVSGVKIGEYSFVGTGTILMPGSSIGKGVIVGAGTVVRGTIPDYSIVIGNPCIVVGNSKEYVEKIRNVND